MDRDIVMVGFGGHARSVADSIERAGEYKIAGYIDIQKNNQSQYNYLGNDDNLKEVYASGIHKAVITIGQIESVEKRIELYHLLNDIGFELPVIVDPSAVISTDVIINEGSFIGKNVVINSGSIIGTACIINTCALCEHDNYVGDFTHIAVKAVCCGNVHIGKYCLIGANSTIIQGMEIGDSAIVGAGATVVNDVSEGEKVVGTPAKVTKR